ncbi:MAG TPA: beta-N-acetylhexosaminidase, partial [Bacteroidales bacterium]|nr:beta-N-acetylhexosaminidase [Bacteroidales bacterium]
MRTLFFVTIWFCALAVGFSQVNPLQISADKQKRVNEIIASMSLEEKIGQLFMVAAYSNKPDEHRIEIE